MEDNLSVLVDAKTEYTKQLTNILVPYIYEGIKSIYDETVEQCLVNEDKSILMRFQEKYLHLIIFYFLVQPPSIAPQKPLFY